MKIVVLEDDPSLLFALTQVLEESGHVVFAAKNILEATDFLIDVAPDLLLLDLMIGEATSIQVADLAGFRAPNAEVVYLTGSNRFPNGELFGLSSNASWVLRKPINFYELQAMLEHFSRTLCKIRDLQSDEVSLVAV